MPNPFIGRLKQKFMENNPNSFDKEIQEAQANPEINNQGTDGDDNSNKSNTDADQNVDYQKKFSESSKEALRLLEENKRILEEKAELERKMSETGNHSEMNDITDDFYPGFNQLSQEEQQNILSFSNKIENKVKSEIYKDPAISFAKSKYNETKFDSALSKIIDKYPDLKESKEEFKSKYFNPNNTPENIENILEDMSKIYLFDKAKNIGFKEAEEQSKRVELERTTGGDKTPQQRRTMEDWERMRMENPVKFASLSKEFNEDFKK